MRLLIDNNIQIYRTMSVNWFDCESYKVFDQVQPILTDYVLMEYRRTVIKGIKCLCELIQDMPFLDSKMLKVRLIDILGELLNRIGAPGNTYVSNRQYRLMVKILGFYLNNNSEYLEHTTTKRFILDLTFFAEELEEHLFYRFESSSDINDVRITGNYHNIFMCSLSDKSNGFYCKKGKMTCNVSQIIDSDGYCLITDKILGGDTKIYGDLNCDHLTFNFEPHSIGKSIGQSCFRISDILHASSCMVLQVGLLTSDKELAVLADIVGINACLYREKDSSFTGLHC